MKKKPKVIELQLDQEIVLSVKGKEGGFTACCSLADFQHIAQYGKGKVLLGFDYKETKKND